MSPQRSCRVCRRRTDKAKLTRWIVQDGKWLADSHQNLPGRGYYSCSPECEAKLPQTIKVKGTR